MTLANRTTYDYDKRDITDKYVEGFAVRIIKCVGDPSGHQELRALIDRIYVDGFEDGSDYHNQD